MKVGAVALPGLMSSQNLESLKELASLSVLAQTDFQRSVSRDISRITRLS